MKRKWLSSAVALWAVSAGAAAAESRTSLRASAGLASPTGEFGRGFASAPNFALAVGHDLGRYFTVSAGVEYAPFSIDESEFRREVGDLLGGAGLLQQLGASFDVDGGETTFLTIAVDFKASILGHGESFSPYLLVGGGVTRRSSGDLDITVSGFGLSQTETFEGDSEEAPSISFGGGADFAIGTRTGLFLEGRYHIAFTEFEKSKYTTLRFGVLLRL